jgi:hypothetical protein
MTNVRRPSRESATRQLTSNDIAFPVFSAQPPGGRPEWRAPLRGRLRQRARLLDEQLAALAGGAALRASLVRTAFRRRDNIPELVVLGLAQPPESRRNVRHNRPESDQLAPCPDTGPCCQ